MHIKWLLGGVALVFLATPALCEQFYIVQDDATKRCRIAEHPPAEGAGIVVGDGVYGDRRSAEIDMATIYPCISQTSGADNR
jgi:hypothetical protein